MVSEPGRIHYIDGLRAVAVLSVVAFHAQKYVPGFATSGRDSSRILAALRFIPLLGYHGVDLFFVLSGFCLAYPTLVRLRRTECVEFDVVHYLSRRIARIVPPYEVALWGFIAMLALLAAAGIPAPPDILPHLNAADVIRDTLLLDRGTTHVDQSFWSLAIELRWYFIFPFALVVWTRFPRAFLLAIALLALSSYLTLAGSPDVAYLPAFLLGIVAADLELRSVAVVRFAPALLLAALIAAFAFRLPQGVPVSIFWQLALFALVVLGGRWPPLRAWLATPALYRIGIASYSMYLVHQPLLALVARPISAYVTDPWLALLVTMAIGVAGGFAFWFVVERIVTQPLAKARIEGVLAPKLARAFALLRIPRSLVIRAGTTFESKSVLSIR